MLLSTEEAEEGEIGPDALDDCDVDNPINPDDDDGEGAPCDVALASTRFIRETDLVKHSTAC